uniref:Uncharacterized protein n=1 Tax=Romanomermis culicivorax TaxID=13658 RepID=A0A915I3B1_ROMCU
MYNRIFLRKIYLEEPIDRRTAFQVELSAEQANDEVTVDCRGHGLGVDQRQGDGIVSDQRTNVGPNARYFTTDTDYGHRWYALSVQANSSTYKFHDLTCETKNHFQVKEIK